MIIYIVYMKKNKFHFPPNFFRNCTHRKKQHLNQCSHILFNFVTIITLTTWSKEVQTPNPNL